MSGHLSLPCHCCGGSGEMVIDDDDLDQSARRESTSMQNAIAVLTANFKLARHAGTR